MLLGERIKTPRKERRWFEDQLAEKVGTGGRQMSRCANGHIAPSAGVLVKLAEEFDVSSDDLLVEDAARRTPRVEDPHVVSSPRDIYELAGEDKAPFFFIREDLLAKNRIKALGGGLG